MHDYHVTPNRITSNLITANKISFSDNYDKICLTSIDIFYLYIYDIICKKVQY